MWVTNVTNRSINLSTWFNDQSVSTHLSLSVFLCFFCRSFSANSSCRNFYTAILLPHRHQQLRQLSAGLAPHSGHPALPGFSSPPSPCLCPCLCPCPSPCPSVYLGSSHHRAAAALLGFHCACDDDLTGGWFSWWWRGGG
jgi:hypothetical protein